MNSYKASVSNSTIPFFLSCSEEGFLSNIKILLIYSKELKRGSMIFKSLRDRLLFLAGK